jgi:hypothetical protein
MIIVGLILVRGFTELLVMDDLQTLLEFFLVGICVNSVIHDERGQGPHIPPLTPFIERSVKTRIHSSQYINRFNLDELLDNLDWDVLISVGNSCVYNGGMLVLRPSQSSHEISYHRT